MSEDPFYNPQVPAHVPPELVLDFNVYSPRKGQGDVLAAYEQYFAQNAPDIFWSRHNGGHWIVARSEYIREMFRDPEHFSNSRPMIPDQFNVPNAALPIFADPPEHTDYRAIISSAFAPRTIGHMEGHIRQKAVDLIESFLGKGECEFISEFALRLPIEVFLRLLDIPADDRFKLVAIVDEIVAHKKDMKELLAEFKAYLDPLLQERRARPGDDVLSMLTQAKFRGRPLTPDELHAFGALLLVGGLDSVASTMGITMAFLVQNPGYYRQLAQNPAIVPQAIEEFLRRFPTNTTGPGRLVSEDFLFHGVQMRKNEHIVGPRPFANLDPRVFADPMKVDFSRKNNMHQAFGNGPHQCIGAFLARTELKIFLEEWLRRIPKFELKPGFEIRFDTGMHFSVHELPLVWGAESV